MLITSARPRGLRRRLHLGGAEQIPAGRGPEVVVVGVRVERDDVGHRTAGGRQEQGGEVGLVQRSLISALLAVPVATDPNGELTAPAPSDRKSCPVVRAVAGCRLPRRRAGEEGVDLRVDVRRRLDEPPGTRSGTRAAG